MTDAPSLGVLISEAAPIVRMFHLALDRDPTAAELDRARRVLHETGSLSVVATSLASGPEFRRRFGRDGDPEELMRSANSATAKSEIALLPGLVPGMPPDEQTAYRLWMMLFDRATERELETLQTRDEPRFAVAMAIGDTEVEAALRSIASLRRQVHTHWTLHLATRLLSQWPRDAIQPLLEDERIIEHSCANGDPLAACIDGAVGDGECCVILEPGDMLARTALHEVGEMFANSPDLAMITTDEDVVDPDGQRCLPRFKPLYSPLASEPPGQLAAYRAKLLRAAFSAPDPAFANPFAAIAASAGRLAGSHIGHLPAILCHRPPSRGDHASRPKSAALLGRSLTTTVIVPTRNRADLLAACAEGVLRRTAHSALRLLVVDNGSDQPDARHLLDTLDADERAEILRVPGPFNFARLMNVAAERATGELLVLLNDDVEVQDPSWLRHLELLAGQAEIGAVGARLLYPDGTIQHAGILLGPDGAATHVGRHFPADDPGYLGRLDRVSELSAVTGACLAIRREVWRRVGGMDERLAVTFNDVDLCLRVRAAGLRVVFTPHATLTHHEAQSRALESSDQAARERFQRERDLLRQTWGSAVDLDPFLNANLLALESGHLVATRPRWPRPWLGRRLPDGGEDAIARTRMGHPVDPL